MSTEIEVKTDTEVPEKDKESEGSQTFSRPRKSSKEDKRYHFSVLRICLDGMMTALFIGLALLKIRIGNVQISFSAIPLCFATLMCGLPDGLVVALLGSFVEQLVSPYGLTVTTVLWMLPHLIRVLVLYFFAYISKKHGKPLYENYVLYFVGMIVSAIFLTGANTLVMWLDAIIIGYPIEIVFVETIIRFATGMLSAVISSIVLLPIIKALKGFDAFKKL